MCRPIHPSNVRIKFGEMHRARWCDDELDFHYYMYILTLRCIASSLCCITRNMSIAHVLLGCSVDHNQYADVSRSLEKCNDKFEIKKFPVFRFSSSTTCIMYVCIMCICICICIYIYISLYRFSHFSHIYL